MSVTFLYNERQFSGGGVERLCALYKFILQQMLVDWNAKFRDFFERLNKRVSLQSESEQTSRDDFKKRIRDFLSQLPILQGLFDDRAELVTFYEGDRISGDMLAKNFIFVADGKLARNVDAGDGWYNPIDIVGKNAFVNPTNFLERQRLTLSAEVLSERAELLTIPRDVLIDVARKNPDVALSLMTYALEQMERWQVLWLQS